MLPLLAASLSDRRSGSEADAVDAFAVVPESCVDFVAGDFRLLPGCGGKIARVLAAGR
jgi:hypothetical protein